MTKRQALANELKEKGYIRKTEYLAQGNKSMGSLIWDMRTNMGMRIRTIKTQDDVFWVYPDNRQVEEKTDRDKIKNKLLIKGTVRKKNHRGIKNLGTIIYYLRHHEGMDIGGKKEGKDFVYRYPKPLSRPEIKKITRSLSTEKGITVEELADITQRSLSDVKYEVNRLWKLSKVQVKSIDYRVLIFKL